MEMITVSSRAINAIGYDPNTKKMKIKFKQGTTYDFCHVPEYIFKGLLSASSKGTYYNDHIRDKYQC
jgi:hypothetical protein